MKTRYLDMGDGTHARVLDTGDRKDRAVTLEGEVTKLRRGAILSADQFHMSLQLPPVLPEKTDVEILTLTSNGGGNVMAGFEGWYE
jgi:hypothetical protein